MLDFSFGGLSLGFQSKQQAAERLVVRRTRITARTAGFEDEYQGSPAISWYGMAPVGTSDEWKLIRVFETNNMRAGHISQQEKLSIVDKVSENTVSFEEAIKYLGVDELSKMRAGKIIAQKNTAEDLGPRHFKYLALRRGLVVDAFGKVSKLADGVPLSIGTFLKSDLDNAEKLSLKMHNGTILDELVSSNDAIDILDEQVSLSDKIDNFGRINTLEMMYFFTSVLTKYATTKLDFVNALLDRPSKTPLVNMFSRSSGASVGGGDITFLTHLQKDMFFSQDFIEQFNTVRQTLSDSVYKAFFIEEKDWGRKLDLSDPKFLRHLEDNPEFSDALDTACYMTQKIDHPIDAEEEKAILFVSVRSLVYLRDMFRDTAQEQYLSRIGIYREGNITDLLTFLDLVEAKYLTTELARKAYTLPTSLGSKDLEEKQKDLENRLAIVAANYESMGGYGNVEQSAVETFISPSTRGKMPERILNLPGSLEESRKKLIEQTLPKPQTCKI